MATHSELPYGNDDVSKLRYCCCSSGEVVAVQQFIFSFLKPWTGYVDSSMDGSVSEG